MLDRIDVEPVHVGGQNGSSPPSASIGANPHVTRAEFGRAKVRKFFERILARLEMTAFNADEFIVQGDTVVVFGSEEGTVRASGQPFRNEWTQKYVVQDDQITSMVGYNIQVEPRD